jgi:hypothetical protein
MGLSSNLTKEKTDQQKRKQQAKSNNSFPEIAATIMPLSVF